MSNAITVENLNTGDSSWLLTQPTHTAIQGYCDQLSVVQGQTINIKVSTQVGGTTYSIKVYRLGWYQGLGGCLKLTVNGLVGVAQGYYDDNAQTLNNCSTCVYTSATGLLEARWATSYSLVVPANWITGVYLVLLTDANGLQSYTHFIVKPQGTEAYAAVLSHMTYAAYNAWGGQSLYTFNSISNVKAVKVSFDRPDTNYRGSGYLLLNDVNAIQFFEKNGFDLSYLSDVDVHAGGVGILNTHKAVISMGHDEYWSFEKRAAFESCIATGIGVAFLGANTCWWQTRMETGGNGRANGTVTCYKVLTGGAGLAALTNDPDYSVGNIGGTNNLVGSNWPDPVLARPEAAMLGIGYLDLNNSALTGWTVASTATSPYLAATGLTPGSTYGTDIVGQEIDSLHPQSPSYMSLFDVIGKTAFTGSNVGSCFSYTTTYIGAGGALVFASGSYMWTWALSDFRPVAPFEPYPFPGSPGVGVSQIQTFFANILAGLIATPRRGPVWGNL